MCSVSGEASGRLRFGTSLISIGAAQVVEQLDLNPAKTTKTPKAGDDTVYKEQLKGPVRLELLGKGITKVCKLDAAFTIYNNVPSAQAVLYGVF